MRCRGSVVSVGKRRPFQTTVDSLVIKIQGNGQSAGAPQYEIRIGKKIINGLFRTAHGFPARLGFGFVVLIEIDRQNILVSPCDIELECQIGLVAAIWLLNPKRERCLCQDRQVQSLVDINIGHNDIDGRSF